MTHPTPMHGSKVGRARHTPGQLWQVPMFLVGLLALLGVAASSPWRLTPQQRDFDALALSLRAGLTNGEQPDALVELGERLRHRIDAFASRQAEAHFLIGSAYYRQGKDKPAALGKEAWPRAAHHLEEAVAQLNPGDADRAAAQYRLGYALYQMNHEDPRALELMTSSIEKGGDGQLVGYRLLVDAHLRQKHANLDAAVSAARRVLDLTSERDIPALAQARVRLGELLMRKELRADAARELARINPKAPRAVRIQAKLLQARCFEEDGQWSKAISIWQDLLAEAPHVDGGRARVLYALGWCRLQKEPPDTQEVIRAWTDALALGGPDAVAAGLRLGRFRLRLGVNQEAQALADWKTALAPIKPNDTWANPRVRIDEVRGWFDGAIQQFQNAQDPEKTQAVAELYRKISPGGEADYRIAKAAESLAQQLADRHKAMEKVTAEEVQAQYRRAGAAYELAAKVCPATERAETLWRGAQCFLAGRDPVHALPLLQYFVKTEANETRLAEGWLTLGDLYRDAGEAKTARDAYYKCIEIPNTLFANKARLHLAIEQREQKKYANAREILEQILIDHGGLLDRPTQEKTLYQMTLVLILLKNYSEAQIHLKEFVRLFPENANFLLARERLGECSRHLALKEYHAAEIIRGSIPLGLDTGIKQSLQDRLRAHTAAQQKLLTEAVNIYQSLADELHAKSLKVPLNDLEKTLIRRARFGIGECHLDAKSFDEAIDVFRKLQQQHRQTVEGFYGCLRICSLVEALRQPPQRAQRVREFAKESLKLLNEDLKAMPTDHEVFRLSGVSPREEWLHWAEKTERGLAASPKKSPAPAFP